MKTTVNFSLLTTHSINCTGQIELENIETIQVEHNIFDRKVREAIEIQYQDVDQIKEE